MSDYIERDVAIDAFCSLADALNSAKGKQMFNSERIEIRGKISGIYLCKGIIRITKPADVAPVRHGRWECGEENSWWCSVCDEEFYLEDGTPQENEYRYCPNCGARMDEEANDGQDDSDR